jgi:Family of unknown function (DUF5989)
MSKLSTAKQMVHFIFQSKKYWLLPLLIILVLFGLLIVFTQSSALAPFIYTIF